MATIGGVQQRIRKVEGFKVRFRHLNGRDVKDNKNGLPQYSYSNMAKNAWSVNTWKEQRFKTGYPGFKIDVLRKDESVCHGSCKLANVRDSYLD